MNMFFFSWKFISCLACKNSRPSLLPAWVAFREKDWSNQSALMTRCGTDLHHQYGILAVYHRCPSRKMPLGPGAKKDGCFHMLYISCQNVFLVHSVSRFFACDQDLILYFTVTWFTKLHYFSFIFNSYHETCNFVCNRLMEIKQPWTVSSKLT